ncbi:hypothetical protein [Pedobacter borealis]|uniref:hypothetical protein n=1 Tax=Pedobacter borealis TaxID=475254 RepID=UPI0004934039|nr:hypothetical protein [Pedobacter borealis]
MQIGIEDLSYHFPLTEPFPVFKGTLLIDGIDVGTTWNEGYGAATHYSANDHGIVLIRQAEDECLSKEMVFKAENGNGELWLRRTLSLSIDQKVMGDIYRHGRELGRHNRAAENLLPAMTSQTELPSREKLYRDMQRGILTGKLSDYYIHDLGISLARIIEHPDAKEILVPALMNISKAYSRKQILNTNIANAILQAAGLKNKRDKRYRKGL